MVFYHFIFLCCNVIQHMLGSVQCVLVWQALLWCYSWQWIEQCSFNHSSKKENFPCHLLGGLFSCCIHVLEIFWNFHDLCCCSRSFWCAYACWVLTFPWKFMIDFLQCFCNISGHGHLDLSSFVVQSWGHSFVALTLPFEHTNWISASLLLVYFTQKAFTTTVKGIGLVL